MLSVAGRLVTTGLQRSRPIAAVVAAVFAIQALAAIVLPLVAATVVGAILTVVGFGLGFGVATIARPALLADRYGTASYATIAGALAVPMTLAKATAPLALAPLRDTWIFVAIAACCAIAALALSLSHSEGGDPF